MSRVRPSPTVVPYPLNEDSTDILQVAPTTASFSVLLPDAVKLPGRELQVVRTNAANAFTVTVSGEIAGQTVGGSSSQTLSSLGDTLEVFSDGANWLAKVSRVPIGGSIAANGDVAIPIAGATVQVADRSEPAFPTVEELFSTRTIEATIAAGATPVKPVFTAPFPLVIRDVWLTNYGGAITMDASNNWSFRFRRYRVVATFATDEVDILDSAGTNFNPLTSWVQGQPVRAFGITYSATNSIFRAGDTFAVRIAANGTPTSLSELCVTVRWEPI